MYKAGKSGMVEMSHTGQTRCTDSGAQCKDAGNISKCAQYGVQTWVHSTGMVRVPHSGNSRPADTGNSAQGLLKQEWWERYNGHSRCAEWELLSGMMGTTHNGLSKCKDPEAKFRDGGNI